MKKQILSSLSLVMLLSCNTEEPVAQEPLRSDKKIVFELNGADYSEPRYDSLKISIYLAAGYRHQDSFNNTPKWDTLFEEIPAKEFINIQDRFEITFEDVSENDVVFYGSNVQKKMLGIVETASGFKEEDAGNTYREFVRKISY